jgi:cytochrome d ubiquinol oxidase subunit I
VTPSLATSDVLLSLIGYIVVYAMIYSYGLRYIYRILRDGLGVDATTPGDATPARPLAVALQGERK